jgi:hypothetical protein
MRSCAHSPGQGAGAVGSTRCYCRCWPRQLLCQLMFEDSSTTPLLAAAIKCTTGSIRLFQPHVQAWHATVCMLTCAQTHHQRSTTHEVVRKPNSPLDTHPRSTCLPATQQLLNFPHESPLPHIAGLLAEQLNCIHHPQLLRHLLLPSALSGALLPGY